MHLSDHDGTGFWHIHFSRNGAPAERWLGQLVAAKLALVAAGDPAVTLGRCAAARLRELLRGPVPQPHAPLLRERVRKPDDGRGVPGAGREGVKE